MTEIIIEAYQVLDAFKKEPHYIEMIELKKKIDHLYPELILAFNNHKNRYQMIMEQGGTYHPDFQTVTQALQISKKTLYEKMEVKRYQVLEKQMQKMLNDFLYEIKEAISPHIKTPNPFGWMDKEGGCHVHK